MVGLPVAGTTIEFLNGYHGVTWADEAGPQSGDDRSVGYLCAALAPLMPAIGDNRADIAIELTWAANEIIALLAGPVAEQLFFTEQLPHTEHDEAASRSIAALVARSPAAIDAYVSFAKIEAATLLAEHAAVVLAIGTELAARRTLTGSQIDAIITDHRRKASVGGEGPTAHYPAVECQFPGSPVSTHG